MTPRFCSGLNDTKQSLQYTIKAHLSDPPMPRYEANMNYIPPSPPSSMKQYKKTATVKFHMELLRPGSNLVVVRHLVCLSKWNLKLREYNLLCTSFLSEQRDIAIKKDPSL